MKQILNNKFLLLLITGLTIICMGCEKYLEEKPNKKLVVPTTLRDLRATLEYSAAIFTNPCSDEASADNYYITQDDLNSLEDEGERRMYTWAPDNIFTGELSDWAKCYHKIYYCNVVLAGLVKLQPSVAEQAEWNTIKGQALTIRAKTFLQIAGIWALAFDEATAGVTLGIPLRLTDNFTERSERGNLKQTYDQIETDLKTAITLLPVTANHVAYVTKPTAYAYLARMYLSMRRYEQAGRYADSCLQVKNTLVDYNTISATATNPFAQFNTEQVYYGSAWLQVLDNNRAKIDTLLYQSYDTNDRRKTIFFKTNADGSVRFKGTYTSSQSSFFAGIAVNEMYLTRAECYARAGNKIKAMDDLNLLLSKRFKTASFVPYTAADATAALQLILKERRKELVMCMVRWMDIKRLNKEGAGITLVRKINNQFYTLPPNDMRYALPLPEDVIELSGMQQNPR